MSATQAESDSRPPFVRPSSIGDIVLGMSFTVEEEGEAVTLTFEPQAQKAFSRSSFQEVFGNCGVVLVNGKYRLLVSEQEVLAFEAPEGLENKDRLIDGQFGQVVEGFFRQVVEGYQGFPSDEMLEQLVGRSIDAAFIALTGDDPLKESLRLPTRQQLIDMKVQGGCASCDFTDPMAGVMAALRGEPPSKSSFLPGVIEVSGIRLRAIENGDALDLVVGYLDHENVFEDYFHSHLAALMRERLPQAVDAQVRRQLVGIELTRRIINRVSEATYARFEIDPDEVQRMADEEEQKVRDALAARREAASQRRGGLRFMTLGPDGFQDLDGNSLEGDPFAFEEGSEETENELDAPTQE